MTGSVPERERAAAQDDCEFARRRFELLFGEAAPGSDIELADTMFFSVTPATDRVHIGWYTKAVLDEHPAGRTDMMREVMDGDRIITHELLHIFFWLRSGDPTDIETATQYGTRRPDWFDEGVAVWGETDRMRLRRWEALTLLPDSVIDLVRFAVEAHPALSDPDRSEGITATTITSAIRCRTDECRNDPDRLPEGLAVRTRSFTNGETIVDTVPESLFAPRSPFAQNFYPLSYGLIRYLYERGGSAAIATVVRRFEGGWPAADAQFTDIPGLPAGLDSIEADWRRWIRSAEPG